jgi:hypothetical protein
VVRTLKDQFPNIRIAYLSSRIYAGYASTTLNPEPYAYESGFAVKWLIEGQIAGADSLEFDPGHGTVEAPWLAWGPYLWADGLTPRADNLTWLCSDFANDGTHPSINGRIKVADLLLTFVHQDETARLWYTTNSTSVPPTGVPGVRLALAPNPVRDRVTFVIAPPGGERWQLEVLDLAGRRVHGIASGVGDGTARELHWDATDAHGARATAGIYFVRLESAAGLTVRRLVLLGPR